METSYQGVLAGVGELTHSGGFATIFDLSLLSVGGLYTPAHADRHSAHGTAHNLYSSQQSTTSHVHPQWCYRSHTKITSLPP